MSLAERLRAKQVRVDRVEVDGDVYNVAGKSKRDRAALMAKSRNKRDGTLNGDKLESLMLESCVTLADDGSAATAAEWDSVPSHITGPLVKAIMHVCGLDSEDMSIDPKDSDSTES